MRWSSAFVPTLRDAPGDAEAASHKLLVRGGFIRQLVAGHYSLLPFGMRVHDKVAAIIRDEMDAIGAQEFLLPAMHPASVWKKSGRLEIMGDEMFRLKDRRDNDVVLGVTHEEIFATVAKEITSYKQLPQAWYQIQTKFRDEPRPRAGLLRVREFAMKDSYSFDIDEAGLDASFERHHEAYVRIFERLDLPAFPVMASSGAMGGSGSTEFMVESAAGEDEVVRCDSCDYAASVERATSALPPLDPDGDPGELEQFDTPDIRTIAALADFEGGAPATGQIKTMVYIADDELLLVLVRGDHNVNEQKVRDMSGAIELRPARPDETEKHLGALPGSLGAVGVSTARIMGDLAVQGRVNMTTGANIDDKHYRNVSVERDIAVDEWVDVRQVGDRETCSSCGGTLVLSRTIEAGHIFKLGTKYSEAMGAIVLDADGKKRSIVMGSYGIGVGRAVASIVETHHDDKGIIWPVAVAPYVVVVTLIQADDDESIAVGEKMYDELRAAGVDTILDDRPGRAGVKFADAELVGIPYRITIGPRGLKTGMVEVTDRASGETVEIAVADAVADVLHRIK